MGTAPVPSHMNNPFKSYLDQIDTISIDELVGEARFGPEFSLREAKPMLEIIKEFTDQLRYVDGSGLPGQTSTRISAAFQEILTTISQMRGYNPANLGGNYSRTRATYIQQLERGYNNLVDAGVIAVLYSNLRASGIRTAERRASEYLTAIAEKSEEQQNILKQSKDLLERQKTLAQEIAVTGYGTLFAKEARRHQKAARFWLGAASLLAGSVAVFAVMNYYNTLKIVEDVSRNLAGNAVPPNFPASLTLQFAIAKIVVFTLGLSAAYWSARVYRSNRHNAVVNQHRANALTSFETFVSSTSDPETKNAVLLQTTSCIYAPQPTAFAGGNEGESESPLKVLEVVRNLQK